MIVNRYVVITEPRSAEILESFTTSDTTKDTFCVVDLTGSVVVARCGADSSTASKVATALNDYDGGPL